jgi:hypothetical protein
MKTVELTELPDHLYEQVEKLAKVRGTSIGAVIADFVSKALTGADREEARLLAEIRAEREEMARRGVRTTAEEIQAAKVEGRK